MFLTSLIKKITDHYFILVAFALALGLSLSDYIIHLAPYATWFLAIIFFFSSLHIDFRQTLRIMTNLKLLVIINLFMLIVFPFVVYGVASLFVPDMRIALLLLAAMPAGMTAPFLTRISGGRENLALVLTVTTSLLAPFTVPFIIRMLAGTIVSVGFWEMFTSLAIIIFIPFFLAQGLKEVNPHLAKRGQGLHQSVSTIFLMLLIAGIVAKQAPIILSGFVSGQSWFYLGVLTVFFIALHLIGYWTAIGKPHADRLAVTICLTYMNFTLAIVLADKFFNTPDIVIPIVLSVIPWSLMLPVFKWLTTRTSFRV